MRDAFRARLREDYDTEFEGRPPGEVAFNDLRNWLESVKDYCSPDDAIMWFLTEKAVETAGLDPAQQTVWETVRPQVEGWLSGFVLEYVVAKGKLHEQGRDAADSWAV